MWIGKSGSIWSTDCYRQGSEMRQEHFHLQHFLFGESRGEQSRNYMSQCFVTQVRLDSNTSLPLSRWMTWLSLWNAHSVFLQNANNMTHLAWLETVFLEHPAHMPWVHCNSLFMVGTLQTRHAPHLQKQEVPQHQELTNSRDALNRSRNGPYYYCISSVSSL